MKSLILGSRRSDSLLDVLTDEADAVMLKIEPAE